MNHATRGFQHLDGKFRVLAQLGQGGTANVCLAVARGPSGFNKLVVLKSMKASLENEPELAGMFLNEARLAARLNHPNIVQTNEVFESEGLPVIVMEYLEGQALSEVVARSDACEGKPFHLAMHLQALSAALEALEYAHNLTDFDGTSLGVVHRDVSPQNVFITFEGSVKLLDFGIAKLRGAQTETEPGVVKGKLRYMAPEQITGEGVDRRADIFAAGVMLWEAVQESRMWSGLGEATIMNRILNGEFSPATKAEPELQRIIAKAMAVEADERYQSARELQAALDEYLMHLGSNVRQRDLGRVVSGLFEGERQRTQRVIEEQLARVASLNTEEFAEVAPLELTQMGSGSSKRVDGLEGQAGYRSRWAWRWSLALVCLLGLGGALLWWKVGPKSPALAASPAPAELEAPAQRVRLTFTAFPAAAELYLNGERLGENPFQQEVERSDETHTLRVKAEGYNAIERSFKLDRDRDIVVALKLVEVSKSDAPAKEAVAEKATTESPREPPPPAPARAWRPMPRPAPLQAQPEVNCEPPYYIDSRGVKKFKAACL